MAEIVNLRQARKRKVRADRERDAERNRALHGRSRSEIERDRQAADRAASFVEGHRRELSNDPDAP